MSIGAFQKDLLRWYMAEHRDLPWRRLSHDPYAVWVSEVMLQQTQVVTVIPFFERWMSKFPTVEALARAEEQEALVLWQGLGYYIRCRNLLKGAKRVVESGMPQSFEQWLHIPGVGRYTAAAIASITSGAAVEVVDGNVERVFARLTCCSDVGATLLQRAHSWAVQVLDKENAGDWNQALMELGATICTPREPSCNICPVSKHCAAKQSWRVDEFPSSPPKVEIIPLKHLVYVPIVDHDFGIIQIPSGSWWEGLWEFPRADVTAVGYSDDAENDELRKTCGEGWLEFVGSMKHRVTNHNIEVHAYILRAETRSKVLRWVPISSIGEVAMPSPQQKIAKMVRRHFAEA